MLSPARDTDQVETIVEPTVLLGDGECVYRGGCVLSCDLERKALVDLSAEIFNQACSLGVVHALYVILIGLGGWR